MQLGFRCWIAVLVSLLSAPAPAAILYVDVSSPKPIPPYTNWSTAAVTLQAAVDAAAAGDEVVVTNGIYRAGGQAVADLMTNRIAVTQPLTVRSVNGPAVTVIEGYQVPGVTNGEGAVRCAYLADGAVLAGFTLTNGGTRTLGDLTTQQNGGAVWCTSASAMLSNCVLSGNTAYKYGGGSCYGTLIGCTLADNSAVQGGGTFYAILSNCTLSGNSAISGGGAVLGGTLRACSLNGNQGGVGGAAGSAGLEGCVLANNSASSGGATFGCTLTDCVLRNNSATNYGGGAYCSTLYNCTVTANSAGTSSGGTIGCPLYNCIVYSNSAPQLENCAAGDRLSYCCTTPLPALGIGNITNAPLFVSPPGDLRLQAASPCINAGLNPYAPGSIDLDGNARIRAGTVDMGAYEFQAEADSRPFAWGPNYYGELGVGGETYTSWPMPVAVNISPGLSALSGKVVVGLAAGAWHSIALCADGTLAGWGSDSRGQLGTNGSGSLSAQSHMPVAVSTEPGLSALAGKIVTAIASGWGHNLALCSDGTVAAWGRNDYGQLGINSGGVGGSMSTVPVPVNTDADVSALHGKRVVAIAAGYAHSLALCADGTVAAWGANAAGQVGDNTTTNRLVPVAVNQDSGISALYGKNVTAIAAGGFFSLAICSDGPVVGWGANGGQLGDNTTTNRLVPVFVNSESGVSALYNKQVVALAAGDGHSLALCSDGTVAAWGSNLEGQLGDNRMSGPASLVPVPVNTEMGVSALAGKSVMSISAGYAHSLALCSDGTAACWGYNHYAQLGDNSSTDRAVPTAVTKTPLAAGQRFTMLVSGPESVHSLALVAGPPVSAIRPTAAQAPTSGALQLRFTNMPGALFEVLAATNPALPLASWVGLTGLTETAPGEFQVIDQQAPNMPRRFYRIRSP